MRPTVDSPVEYALYALVVEHPSLFAEAEEFFGSMLANDQQALARVKELVARSERQATQR